MTTFDTFGDLLTFFTLVKWVFGALIKIGWIGKVLTNYVSNSISDENNFVVLS